MCFQGESHHVRVVSKCICNFSVKVPYVGIVERALLTQKIYLRGCNRTLVCYLTVSASSVDTATLVPTEWYSSMQ